MINTVLIDDESDGLEDLKEAVQKYCPEISLLGIYQTPSEGLTAIQQLKPDLVFLDVQMPGMSGFELLQKLSPVSFHVIFVSAYDRYAIRAIKFSALDYLLKPVDVDELIQAVSRVKERMSPQQYSIQSVLQNTRNKLGHLERLAVPTSTGIDYFDVKDIIFLKADGCYTHIYLTNKNTKLVTKVLKDFEEVLADSGFCRVHNSFLINLRHVKSYVRGEGGYVILADNHHVDISRRRKEEFLTLMNLRS